MHDFVSLNMLILPNACRIKFNPTAIYSKSPKVPPRYSMMYKLQQVQVPVVNSWVWGVTAVTMQRKFYFKIWKGICHHDDLYYINTGESRLKGNWKFPCICIPIAYIEYLHLLFSIETLSSQMFLIVLGHVYNFLEL